MIILLSCSEITGDFYLEPIAMATLKGEGDQVSFHGAVLVCVFNQLTVCLRLLPSVSASAQLSGPDFTDSGENQTSLKNISMTTHVTWTPQRRLN